MDPTPPLKVRVKAELGTRIRQALIPVGRWMSREQRRELESLAAYGGLVHQAFQADPFRPWVCTDVVREGVWESPGVLQPTESPSRRERDNGVHHYGHDVVLKRAAGLPLVGRALPFMLEHGVNFSDVSSFEDPLPWVKSYLCMGPHRAARLRERFGVRGIPVGPYVAYARSVLRRERQAELRERLGRTLLVIPAHSVAHAERHWSAVDLIPLVERHCREAGFRTVIWQGFWKDRVPPEVPSSWIQACNGHYSNPWFLDCQRTLLELADTMLAFTLGSHVGYALALGKPVLMAPLEIQQDLSSTTSLWRERYDSEWTMRARLLEDLGIESRLDALQSLDSTKAMDQLDPYFGFSCRQDQQNLASSLKGVH